MNYAAEALTDVDSSCLENKQTGTLGIYINDKRYSQNLVKLKTYSLQRWPLTKLYIISTHRHSNLLVSNPIRELI